MYRKKFIPVFISAVLTAAVSLTSCSDASAPARKSFFAMDTYMTVTVYGENAGEAAGKVSYEISRLGSLWSVTDENSEIYRIDHSGGQPVSVSRETADIISTGLEISGYTGGALDCTVYPVLARWGFTTGEYRIPEDEEISELLEYTGYEKISVEGDTVTVPENTMIDLGALGKGRAGAIAADILRENGIRSAILDLGGNIQTVGTKPDGTDWRLGIRSPFDAEKNIGVIEVSDCAAVTSGGYERYFVGSDGETYCHIIDPATGRPAESGLASVTVIGRDGTLCDGLSTALYVLGAEKAEELWKQRDDFEMILITDGNEIIITEGIAEKFTPARDNSGTEVKIISRQS